MSILGNFPVSMDLGRLLAASKPDRDDAAAYARWLVSQNSWGVLNTISIELEGASFGNVVSFSEGLPDRSTGIPYFYLTTLDPTARNALKGHTSSLTISEYPLGTCGKADPESPVCAKIFSQEGWYYLMQTLKRRNLLKRPCSQASRDEG
ncbi:hypothetical protein CRYUN_Cryun15aG0025800 [Craigia yunnanensis]